jgi:hypothetical protein
MLPLFSHDEDEIDEFQDDIDSFRLDSPMRKGRTGEERGITNMNVLVLLERPSPNVDFPEKNGMLESTPERRSSNFDVPRKSGMLESTDERRPSNFHLPSNTGERRSSAALGNERRASAIRHPSYKNGIMLRAHMNNELSMLMFRSVELRHQR